MSAVLALRDFRPEDADALNCIALTAFEQFKDAYADWPALAARVSAMSKLVENGEIIVAELDGHIVGGVAYIGADKPKPDHFDPSWPTIRTLVVDPVARGQGLGRRLVEECAARARRDGASVIALHTSPIMTVALPMYLRMGFKWSREAPPICGARYAVYVLALSGV